MKTVGIVVVVVAAFIATAKSVDHRCQFTETKVDNCTRTVYFPCPSDDDSDSNSDSSDDSSSDEDVPHSRNRRSVEDFIARVMRRWFRAGSDTNWCQREETFTCVMYRCYIGCCPGWKFDEDTGTCSIPEEVTPEIECKNGGYGAMGPEGWRCECPSTHTGKHCDDAVCTMDCQNDGMCDVVDGRPRCICSDSFSGHRCQNPVCQGGCGLYGHCVAEDGEAVCQCSPGYKGTRCQTQIPKPEKEGDCPPIGPETNGICILDCQADSGCPGKQKCCRNGCGQVCMNPANYTCNHNGVFFKIGAVFNPDPCTICTCLTPDPSKAYGGAQCRTMSCPPLQEGCKRVLRNNDACCPYCGVSNTTTTTTQTTQEASDTRADKTTTMNQTTKEPEINIEKPDLYEEPHFLNCPDSILTIDVAHDRNYAKLPFELHARDHKDKELAVTLTRREFRAGVGEQNFDTVMATSERDVMGNFAYCEFHVRIRDVHAPNFTYCPPDVILSEDGPANWRTPEAVDNVGLARQPTSRFQSGQHFSRGEHPVVYSSEDFEGNMARCHFLVKVGDYGPFGLRQQEQKDQERNRHMMFIGVGVAAFLFIILIVVVATLCRRRRVRRDPPVAPPAYENGIYNIGVPIPPPYKEKPPVYVEEDIPEKKEDVYEDIPEKKEDGEMDEENEQNDDKAALDAEDVDVKFGVDNPTYRL